MRHAPRTVGVLFLACSSVYAAQASGQSKADSSDQAAVVSPVQVAPVGSGAGLGGGQAEVIQVDAAGPKGTGLREGASVRPGQVNVSESGTVEIHVSDANLLEVLKMLASQSQKNIIVSKEVRGAVTANLYDVTIKEALDAILHSNGFAYREKGNFIYVYTNKELAELERSTRKTNTEVFRLFYTPAGNAGNMIKSVLSDQGQFSLTTPAESGIGSGATDVGGNSHATDDVIVVTDYPENLDKVREVLKEIDRRPQQILVEATILRASLTEDNSLGVDFTLLGGVDFKSITGLGSNSGPGILDGSVVNNGSAGNFLDKGFGGAGTGFTNGLPTGGLRMGFVSNNIGVFLQALESVTDTTVLANPKILALNKQKGEVIVGRKDGYLTTTVTSSSTVQTVEFLDTGTRLVFRPFIGDDGYIRMEIHPEDSSGGLTSNANLPFKITTEVTSNVMVKDGRTIVIGGLFRESTDSSKSQVPFLGNIPLAGNLFKNQRDRTTREEIIILLTPHIIKDDEAYSKDSIASQKDFEKLRVGVRKGMMVTGRERLAEISYEKAVAEMGKPNPDRNKALWHLDAATNLNPKFAEAIAMKEKLTGVELSTVDGSSVRGFVRRRVMAESHMSPTTLPASRRLPEPRPSVPEIGALDEGARIEAQVAPMTRTRRDDSTGNESPAKELLAKDRPMPKPGQTPSSEQAPKSGGLGLSALMGTFWGSSSSKEAAVDKQVVKVEVPAAAVPVPALVATPATQPSVVEAEIGVPSTQPSVTVLELPEKP